MIIVFIIAIYAASKAAERIAIENKRKQEELRRSIEREQIQRELNERRAAADRERIRKQLAKEAEKRRREFERQQKEIEKQTRAQERQQKELERQEARLYRLEKAANIARLDLEHYINARNHIQNQINKATEALATAEDWKFNQLGSQFTQTDPETLARLKAINESIIQNSSEEIEKLSEKLYKTQRHIIQAQNIIDNYEAEQAMQTA